MKRTQERHLTTKFLTLLATVWLVSLATERTHAALLVGTVVTSGTETIPEMNQLVTDYNTDFGASLPNVDSLLDKIEGQDNADFSNGNLALADFDFYQEDNSGSTNVSVFDTVVKFVPSTLGVADGFDSLDENVFGFEQLSGPSFYYYVSKDGNLGWSLWVAGPGINPVYTDSATGGFTRGNTSNNALDYDPINKGVSHISFYSAQENIVVPEPSAILMLGIVVATRVNRRRRRR